MKKFFIILLLLVVGNYALAQQSCDCDIALNNHATDEFYTNNRISYNEATNELFMHDYDFWTTYASINNHSLSLKAAYSIFSASFASNNANSEKQEKFESMRTNYSKNHTLSQEEEQILSSKIASRTAYDAWIACIKQCVVSGEPFLKKEGTNNDEFIVSLRWVPNNGQTLSTRITRIAMTNCSFENGDLKENTPLLAFGTLLGTFKRINRNIDVTIVVTVDNWGAKTIIIPRNEKLNQVVIPPPVSQPSVPPGTVVAFAGNTIPNGWLLCDGSVQNQSQYPALYAAIGSVWGSGNSSPGSFNLPDMQGLFLRGVDYNANNDPQKNNRNPQHPGGQSNNNVGSVEPDAFQGHFHSAVGEPNARGITGPLHTGWGVDPGNGIQLGSIAGAQYPLSDGPDGPPRISSETRPKNVYVNYIIKY